MNVITRERFRPVNLRPLPHQIGPEYNALHGELCAAQRLARRAGSSMARLISHRDALARDADGCEFLLLAAKFLGWAINRAQVWRRSHQAKAAGIEAELDRLFAAWCEERGTTPDVYVKGD
jgi:hypothetical protein